MSHKGRVWGDVVWGVLEARGRGVEEKDENGRRSLWPCVNVRVSRIDLE